MSIVMGCEGKQPPCPSRIRRNNSGPGTPAARDGSKKEPDVPTWNRTQPRRGASTPVSRGCWNGIEREPPADMAAILIVDDEPSARLTLGLLLSTGGERRFLAVRFSDLRGSMELLVGHELDVARLVLDTVIERLMEAVHRTGGTVNQVMGDGIMALFGAPAAYADHAIRAC